MNVVSEFTTLMIGAVLVRNRLTRLICTTLALGFMASTPNVQAAEEQENFNFDKVVVTALRSESKELETPANVTVKTGDELKATGAATVIDALQFFEGINIYSQNPYGHSGGRMSSELVIRGAKKGTLIMVNGAPINMNGTFQLDNILLEDVEKVEVVRGPGSVMYGSEAFGGVINIITKKQVANSFTTSAGSHGKQNHNLNLQVGKLAITSSFVEAGEVSRLTETAATKKSPATYTDFTGGQKINLNGAYRFDNNLTLYYTHTEDDIDKEAKRQSDDVLSTLYNDTENLDRVNLQYQDGSWNANLYGTFRQLDYSSKDGSGVLSSDVNLKTSKYGLDTNKLWNDQNMKYLTGITLEQEKYKKADLLKNTYDGTYRRNIVSLYTQATREFSEISKLVVGLRGQSAEVESGDKYNQLLPQIQYNQKVGKDSSWFVNVGKAFRLPTLTELHAGQTSNFTSNPNLKPESGWSYETGWKMQKGNGLLKTTIFAMDIKDHIDTNQSSVFENFGKFKNEGVEVSWEQKLSDKYSYIIGGAYGNPRQLNADGNWERAYGRIQGNLMLCYTYDKLTANLAANYTGDRSNNAPAALPVSLKLNYQLKPDTMLFTTIRNVLNRHDVTTNSASYYYGEPRTVEFGIKHTL